jgi:hypothetical protein
MLKFSFPAAWWLGLAVIPIVIFYFLRMRFRKQPVSSIYIWSQLPSAAHGAGRFHSRTIWLLLLQLLSAMAAVLAVAEPVWKMSNYSKPGIIYLIDVSASMEATEKYKLGNRITEAKNLIMEEIRRQPRGTEGMIFLCSYGIVPLGNPTADRNQLLSRVGPVRAGSAGFDEEEVAQELQAWLAAHQKPWQAVLVTDGGLDLGGRKLAGLFAGTLKTLMVGHTGSNVGVTALRLLPDLDAPSRVVARFQIYNGWPGEQTIRVILEYNDQNIMGTDLKAPRGMSNQILAFPGPLRTGIYKIRLEQYPDAIEADNQFLLAVNPPRIIRVLLVGDNNPFLRAVFSNSQVELSWMNAFPPGNFNGAEWDLIVADGVPIPYTLRCNLLAFGVAPPGHMVRMGNPVKGELRNISSVHPLLRFTDWTPVQVLDGRSLEVRSGVQVLATVNEQPVIAAWEEEGGRHVVVGTDLYRSDLGLSGSFPVFIQNLLHWCVPQGNNPLAYTLTVGETKVFAEPPAWQILNADYIDIQRKGSLLTLKPLAAGAFRWGQGMNRGFLTANPPASELNIAPRSLDFPKGITRFTAEYTRSYFSFSNLALGLLLVCLSLEWILWRGLPKRKE